MSGQRQAWRVRFAGGVVLALLVAGVPAQDRGPATIRSDVVVQALSLLGTPYRYGGASPQSGFDCSGLVRHVYASVLNQELPRRSEDISGLGVPVSRAELQPGDLVFFNTLRRAFSHVAIYIGEGRFVHAPARSGRVRIEGLDDRYWAARFDGARRMIDPASAKAASGGGAPTDSLESRQPARGSAASHALTERPPEP
jgi:cell wall-associated NlpC family hydrolase